VYQYSLAMKSPAELVQELSFLGAESLMKKIFQPENYRELMKYFPAVHTLHHSLMEGARLIQIFAYGFEEDFTAKVEIKKVDFKNGKQLPNLMPDRGHFRIYLPRGRGLTWNVSRAPGAPGLHWLNNEAVWDEPDIRWSFEAQRFLYRMPDGQDVPCRWKRHHEIGDEGPPGRRVGAPFRRREDDDDDDEEVEEEIMFDEPEEEGDDF
jgi:hypothetical protein